ncbi:MAG: HlyD family secretion protein, partial [Bacteroidales bacterium]
VQQGAEGAFVWVVDMDGKARPRPVVVDKWQQNDWIVSEGLRQGDQVVVDGTVALHAGTPVVVKPAAATKTAE